MMHNSQVSYAMTRTGQLHTIAGSSGACMLENNALIGHTQCRIGGITLIKTAKMIVHI